jgi:hypothetical protein
MVFDLIFKYIGAIKEIIQIHKEKIKRQKEETEGS